jgi:hypothetical protein
MSKRMKFVLQIQAQYLCDNLKPTAKKSYEDEGFQRMMDKFWTETASSAAAQFYHHTPTRRSRDTKIFHAVYELIHGSIFPTVESIAAQVSSDWEFRYCPDLIRDKTIKADLRVLVEFAKDQDELAGTGRFGQSMEEYRDSLLKLNTCRNDKEYGFVARMCKAPMDLPCDKLCYLVEE